MEKVTAEQRRPTLGRRAALTEGTASARPKGRLGSSKEASEAEAEQGKGTGDTGTGPQGTSSRETLASPK